MIHPFFLGVYCATALESIILISLSVLCFHKRTRLSINMGLIFVFAFLSMAGYVCGFVFQSETISKWGFFVYYSGNTLMLNALYFFCVRFTGMRFPNSHSREISAAISILDIIIILLLTAFDDFATLNKLIYYGKLVYKPSNWHWYFNIHLGISYLFSLGSICLLIYKACSTPPHNRSKFLNILLVFLLLLFVDAIFVLGKFTFDITNYALGLASIIVYFFCYIYKSRHYLLHTAQSVLNDSNDIIICFDESDKCIWYNQTTKDYLKKITDLQNYIEKEFEKWKNNSTHFDDMENEVSWRTRIPRENDNRDIKITLLKKHDELDNYLGCYFRISDITEEKKQEEKEKKQRGLDPLTGIPNRDYFFNQVKRIIKTRTNTNYLLICSNIVDFKIFNNIFGEEAGNNVLKRNAEYINNHNGVSPAYGRISGDMFAMLLDESRYRDDPFIDVMHSIEQEFSNTFFHLHMQMGIYKIENLNEPVSSMVEKAILAMKSSKSDFSKRVSWYVEDTLSDNLKEKLVMGKFEQSLQNGEFKMFLQPQVTENDNVIGAEVLARWIDSEGNIISPAKFIPVLENNGMISKLDRFIWEEAAKQLERWKKMGRDDLHLSVNISVKDFYHEDLYKVFTDLTEKYNIDPSKLKLEITETAIISDPKAINELLQKLRQFGFKVELDDFGSGYSSLGLLKDISVDTMKIDMSFLRHTEEHSTEKSWLILNEIIRLAKTLKMETIIEGVEEEEQANKLKEMGCDVFQGFYFAKPETVTSFEERVRIF